MKRVGDLVIVEPHSGKILYRGTIDSDVSVEIAGVNFSLQGLLRPDAEILLDSKANESNQKSLLEEQESEGCDRLLSGIDNNQESPDYVTDVAPILKEVYSLSYPRRYCAFCNGLACDSKRLVFYD